MTLLSLLSSGFSIGKSGEHGLGKRLTHSAAFVNVVGISAKCQVGFKQKYPVAVAFKANPSGAVKLPAVEAQVVGSDAGLQGWNVKEVCGKLCPGEEIPCRTCIRR